MQAAEPRRAYGKQLTLFGSLMRTYLPSGCFMHMSVTVRTIPQPFASETFSCEAKSVGRVDIEPKMTWRVLSRGFAREMNLRIAGQMGSARRAGTEVENWDTATTYGE